MKKIFFSAVLMVAIATSASAATKGSWPIMSVDIISTDDSYNAGCNFYSQGDTVSAAKCFQESARSGNANGQYMYGLFKLGGLGGIRANEKAGLRMIRKAAEHGESDALFFLGSIYESGSYGCPVNETEALNLYKRASQAGCLDGHIACGNKYWLNGDTAMAIQYWTKAAEETSPYFVQENKRAALAQITYNLGWFSQSGTINDMYAARDYYQLSVEYGNTKDAAYQLGLIYIDGAYVLEPDADLATYYFSMAAEAGHAEACVYMGDLMRLSNKDNQGLQYYLAGSQGGSTNAMYCLASMYYERGEFDSAIYWASQCTDNVLAVYLLGHIYYQKHDLINARLWWENCVHRFHYDDALIMLRHLSSGDWTDQIDINGFVRM